MNKREAEIALKSMSDDKTRVEYIDFLLKMKHQIH